MKRPKTIICDIDGTLIYHYGSLQKQVLNDPVLLPDVKDRFEIWDKKGYNIILITGRRESLRNITEKQLESLGLFYDQLVMGVGGGQRVLINDLKTNTDELTAISYNIQRNKGLSQVNE